MSAGLLAAYDAQCRAHTHEPAPDGLEVSWDGPVKRTTGFGGQGWVEYHDLGGLDGEELDDLIGRQVEYFRRRGQRFEWKYHSHDLPADLPQRLIAAGFTPEEAETVVVAEVAALDLSAGPPDGVEIREATDRADLRRIGTMEEEVWNDDHSWLEDLASEREADPDSLRIFLAEAGGTVVSAGWIRFPSDTEFGTLWGGATLEEWRGRGIYKALVAARGRLAAERGRRWLQVDASDDSRPILEWLGFLPLTTTTPYIWDPSSSPIRRAR